MDQYIHIALVGAVSAGKSTLLNAILVARYSDMSIQRTTANDIIYYETKDTGKTPTLPDIHELNKKANREIMNKTLEEGGELKITDIKKIEYYVPHIYNLLEGKLKPGIRLAIHDLPGLNDANTATVYHQYVANNFCQYDIVLFIVDVVSGLNTKDEKNILELILKGIKLNKDKYGIETELMVVLNKCDEMELIGKNSYETRPIDDEYKAMVEQVRTIVTTTAKTMKVDKLTTFVCLSGEDSYIYRMYSKNPLCTIDAKHRNKFGINEYGKNQWNKMDENKKIEAFKARMTAENIKFATELTGFTFFDFKLANILTDDKQFIYLLNHLRFEVAEKKMMAKKPGDTIDAELEQFAVIRDKLADICKNYNKKMPEYKFFQEKFTSFLTEFNNVNAKYLVQLKPTKDDSIMYTISSGLTKIFTTIDKSFRCWINDIMAKNTIVTDNIDKYLCEVIACYTTPYSMIIDMLGKFINDKMKITTVNNLCCNLCHYDFIKTECCSQSRDEGKTAEKIISIIGKLQPSYTATQWCHCIVENVMIIINQWSTMGGGYITDPFTMIQIFDKYHVHSEIKDVNGYDIKQKLKTVQHWAYKNMNQPTICTLHLPSILMNTCLTFLNNAYPKHVVDLDVFNGVPREHTSLPVDKFYGVTKK